MQSKTTKQRQQDGSRHRPDRHYAQPQPVDGEPEQPAFLDDAERAWWDILAAELKRQQRLTMDVGPWLVNASRAGAAMLQWREAAKQAPLIYEKVMVDGTGTEHREPKAHPAHVQGRLAVKAFVDLLKEAGLTPATVARVKLLEPVKPKEDPFTAFQHKGGIHRVK